MAQEQQGERLMHLGLRIRPKQELKDFPFLVGSGMDLFDVETGRRIEGVRNISLVTNFGEAACVKVELYVCTIEVADGDADAR